MIFLPTRLSGAWIIEVEPALDSRGSFSRTFCEREFSRAGLHTQFVQHSISTTRSKGTLRGMHFQLAPHSEIKVVRCTKGVIWDVVIDLRRDSKTYRRWQGFELSAENRRQLYIPAGFAHGHMTLCDDAETCYLISAFHEPAASAGIRFDDPGFALEWPLPPTVISDRDRSWPNFSD
jgi:dTDP-4-dehydrorhamnose 3,5-epimerase